MYALMETVPNWKDEAKFARVVAVVARDASTTAPPGRPSLSIHGLVGYQTWHTAS